MFLFTSQAFSLWVGYGWTPLIQPPFGDEQRPFLQGLFEHPLGAGAFLLVNRTRLEARVFTTARPCESVAP